MDTAVGALVKIKTKNGGSFKGIIHATDRNNKRITIEKVYLAETNEKLQGKQHFFDKEITSITILEEAKQSKKVTEVRYGRSIVKKKAIPQHLAKLRNLDKNTVLLSRQDLGSTGDESTNNKGKGKSSDTEGDNASDSFHVLTEINKEFLDAIDYLSKQKFIGFAAEGIELSRSGELCWIQMSTREEVILFDMISLGKMAVEGGIAQILENPDIQKVLHDCRFLSDMFYHQFGVHLKNIFDTQVAAAIVFRNENYGCFSQFVQSLPQCLSFYLKIDDDKLIWTKYREECKKDDMAVWAERPARNSVVRLAASNVQHLLDLRRVLLERMIDDFYAGIDIYLSVVRDLSSIQLKKDSHKLQPHLLPDKFKHLQHESYHSQFGNRYRSSRADSEDNGPQFKETCINRDPSIVYSHDSVWHENTRPMRPHVPVNRRGFRAPRQHQHQHTRHENNRTTHARQSINAIKLVTPPTVICNGKSEDEKTHLIKSADETKSAKILPAERAQSDPPSAKAKQSYNDSAKETVKNTDQQAEQPGAKSQGIECNIDVLLNVSSNDESDENEGSPTSDGPKPGMRFIAAGYESSIKNAKTATAAPIVHCNNANLAELNEEDYLCIPTHSGGRSALSRTLGGANLGSDGNYGDSKGSTLKTDKELLNRLGDNRSVPANEQLQQSPQTETLRDSYDSLDSGNESGQAGTPKRGLGRGAIMKAFAKNF